MIELREACNPSRAVFLIAQLGSAIELKNKMGFVFSKRSSHKHHTLHCLIKPARALCEAVDNLPLLRRIGQTIID